MLRKRKKKGGDKLSTVANPSTGTSLMQHDSSSVDHGYAQEEDKLSADIIPCLDLPRICLMQAE
jgi:hypothetical protein